ncbi:MAG: gas vesicle protein GvpN [Nitrospinota bacterium]
MREEMTTILEPRPMPGFVDTPYIQDVVKRAMACIEAGFPVHFRGVSGTGKTTLAMHVAAQVGRPVVMIHGDEEFSTSDLVGGEHGYRIRKVVDNFIHSVLKTEEDMMKRWVDNRLTVACKYGFTLIYDEFTRSRPEANNILLSILQEKMMDLPAARDGESYLKVDPDFTAIFTSNPEEYAGTHKTQDALRDRMITLDLDHFDRETEVAICTAKSGVSRAEAERIVDMVRGFRASGKYEFAPTVRAGLMIGKLIKVRGAGVDAEDRVFQQICLDVVASETSRIGLKGRKTGAKKLIADLIDRHCNGAGPPRKKSRKKVMASA